MALIEGLDDAVQSEYARIRAELRVAIAESRYTKEEVASLSGVSVSNLRSILNAGEHAVQIDTLLRIAFAVGARIDLARAQEGERERPFSARRNGIQSTSSRRSSNRSAAGNLDRETGTSSRRSSAKQAKKSARKVNRTSWFRRSTVRPAAMRSHLISTDHCGTDLRVTAFGLRPAPIPQEWGESGDEFESVPRAA